MSSEIREFKVVCQDRPLSRFKDSTAITVSPIEYFPPHQIYHSLSTSHISPSAPRSGADPSHTALDALRSIFPLMGIETFSRLLHEPDLRRAGIYDGDGSTSGYESIES